jgi:hypothetical protein
MASSEGTANNNNVIGKYLRSASRVARWCILKPKIQIWVNFGGPWNEKGWYILLKNYHPIPWWESISRPLTPVSSAVCGVDTTIPHSQGKVQSLRPFVNLVPIWNISPPPFGILCQEKSGNPVIPAQVFHVS